MDVMTAIRSRHSIRAYRPDPVPEESLDVVLEAFRLAPSGMNKQPWKVILVRDEARRRAFAEACFKQLFIAQAPLVLVACALPGDLKVGGTIPCPYLDVTIAMDHLTLAATALGLGTCWIGGFDTAAVRALLGIPADVQVIAATPLGYPAAPAEPTTRKPLADIVCHEQWE